jgi:hypothetical protein
MKENISNVNSKGQRHGYLHYYVKNILALRCTYKNGNPIGYEEWHNVNQTRYYIR